MTPLTPREIIAKAWTITKKERQVRRWGYVASIAETLLNLKLLIYQVWFLISYLQGDPIGFFTVEATLMDYVPFWLFMTFIITLIVLLIIEWLFPHLAKGAIIGLAAKSYKKEEVKGGLVFAVYNFFPIFAIHEMFFLGRLTVVITISSLLLRYGGAIAPIAIGILVIAYIASNIFAFFCVFAEEAVVIYRDDDNNRIGVGRALKQSFKLVISYLGHIVFLMLLSFIIILRVILNFIIVFLIPGAIIAIVFIFSLVLPAIAAWIIGGICGIVLIGVASYFFAYLAVFKQSVWTITYMELEKMKDLDVIEIGDTEPLQKNASIQ